MSTTVLECSHVERVGTVAEETPSQWRITLTVDDPDPKLLHSQVAQLSEFLTIYWDEGPLFDDEGRTYVPASSCRECRCDDLALERWLDSTFKPPH